MRKGKLTKWIAAVAAAAVLACAPAASAKVLAATASSESKAGLDKTSVVLDVKQTAKITLKNVSGTVKWASSNPKAAKVKGSGKSAVITAGSKAGQAKIVATVGKTKYTCKVNVYKFTLSPAKMSLISGKKKTLTLKNASKAEITWKSSKPEVAEIITINKNKVRLQAGAAGTSKVTAKVGKKTYTCKVTVKLNSIKGSWSGNQYVTSNGSTLKAGAYPIGNSYYVFDENGYVTGSGWHAIDGYWYYSDSEGKTAANSWANVPDNTQDEYWTNYTYYHDKKYFDSKGRWDMTKANKVAWDAVYRVLPRADMTGKADEVQQAVYYLKPKKGKKIGYYQWILGNGSVKYNDNRPIYAVKDKVYVAFGAPWSIQVKDLDFEIAKDSDPMVKKVLNKTPLPIGYIGNKKIIYP